MGSSSSKERNFRQPSSVRSVSSSYGHPSESYYHPQSYYPQENQHYPQESPNYAPQSAYEPSPSYGGYIQEPKKEPTASYGGYNRQPKKKLERRYSRIADDYKSLDQVTEALARAGLESSNLIIGIDFTKSNEWTGAKSFNRKSLHHIGPGLNPYEQAISIIGKTLAAFDDDNLIPCFGFGDASTHDQDVFSFYPDERYCNGFEEVLSRYKEIVPHLRLAGPTSFAPIVEMAMTIVEQSGGQYHVLLIIADGQVTRSVETGNGQLSPQEQKTIDAIVKASKYPLSIVLVGVGDGPWDMMKEFDDNIPDRDFDNFQFVNFTQIMSKNVNPSRKETEFALAALMEIPSQYKATIELNLLGKRRGSSPERVCLPPPMYNAPSFGGSKPFRSTSFQQSAPYYESRTPVGTATATATAPPVTSSASDNMLCPICLSNNKDMAFGCGHQTCCDCGQDLEICPICRRRIETRIRLY
ncbi:E3 ubiquitin-protein ligase rglg2 [Ancistrocladus abbreviatus]